MFKNLWPGSLNDPEITGFLTAVWIGQGELLWNKVFLQFWEREDPFAFLVRCRDGKVDIHIGRLCGHPSTVLWFSREIELYIYIYIHTHTHTHTHKHPRTHTHAHTYRYKGFLGCPGRKESACNTGDLGSIPWFRRSPREGNGYPV